MKLMRKLPRFEHRHRVGASRLGESRVEFQWRRSRFPTRLVGQSKKLLLGLKLIIAKGNVGSFRRRGLKQPLLGWRSDSRAFGRNCHQTGRGLYGGGARPKQERQQ